jgi:hypothetical protein
MLEDLEASMDLAAEAGLATEARSSVPAVGSAAEVALVAVFTIMVADIQAVVTVADIAE